MTSRPPEHTCRLDAAALAEVRAALEAGASPAAALAAGFADRDGPLGAVVRSVRLGQPVARAAESLASGDPAADLLVRALGVAERSGAGTVAAVEQALAAAREERLLDRLLQVRTAQARGTAAVLTALPLAGWLLALAAGGGRFFTTPLGIAISAAAVLLALGGRVWSTRIVAAARRAPTAADPLAPPRPRADLGRALAAGLPALALTAVAVGALPAVGVAGVAAAVAARPRRPAEDDHGAGGAAETVELVTVALRGGLSPAEAVATVAPLAPPAAAPILASATRRLQAGWAPDAAFAGTPLAALGAVLAATQRWGAPAAAPLRVLADDLRGARRAAAEEAAERVQLRLVFPTTLLTLPAFVLAVVPPLLWTALAG